MSSVSSWPALRLKYTCQVNPSPPKVPDDQEVSFVPMEAVSERGGISTDATRPAGSVKQGYTGFQDGDVVVAKITPCFENGKGSIVEGMQGGVGYGTTELHVLRALHAERRWLFYLTQSRHFMGMGEGSMYGAGGQKRVPPDFIRNYEAVTPPLPTQKAIADFLDRKTAAIDALIEKKQKLLDLLAEKRAALINQAVTKGLDPNVPMKDSGIPWIGEIPAHWDVKRLKQVSHRVVVGIAEAATHAYADEGVPIVRSTNVRADRLNTDSLLFIQKWFADRNRSKYIRGNDLLTVRTGHAGVTAVVPPELDGCQCFTMLITTLDADQTPEFFSFYLNSAPARAYFSSQSWGTAQANISVPILKEAPVPVPPPSEQAKLALDLRRRLGSLDGLVRSSEQSLSRLQEYRQALITAAVTGQLDIGEEAG